MLFLGNLKVKIKIYVRSSSDLKIHRFLPCCTLIANSNISRPKNKSWKSVKRKNFFSKINK